ncbi:MAG: hypothetical protein EA355_00240 [Rhodobacteraceae bacterium]|nr:MAG: hypothetical protein EA355_00240 [Paracoccaceae bacterium]
MADPDDDETAPHADAPAASGAEAADLIGRHLRELYAAVEQEPLPDRLTALLHRLADTPADGQDGR